MLMNDTTYLLDESMQTLMSIRELQDLMDNQTEWDKLSAVSRLITFNLWSIFIINQYFHLFDVELSCISHFSADDAP